MNARPAKQSGSRSAAASVASGSPAPARAGPDRRTQARDRERVDRRIKALRPAARDALPLARAARRGRSGPQAARCKLLVEARLQVRAEAHRAPARDPRGDLCLQAIHADDERACCPSTDSRRWRAGCRRTPFTATTRRPKRGRQKAMTLSIVSPSPASTAAASMRMMPPRGCFQIVRRRSSSSAHVVSSVGAAPYRRCCRARRLPSDRARGRRFPGGRVARPRRGDDQHVGGDGVGQAERLRSRGKLAFVKLFGRLAPALRKDRVDEGLKRVGALLRLQELRRELPP